jgi:hypothetical protein
MRTTISIDDRLGERVKRRAAREGLSVSAFIARVLDDALKRDPPRPAAAFRLVTVGEGGVYPGVDLDKPGALQVAEDEAAYAPRARPVSPAEET